MLHLSNSHPDGASHLAHRLTVAILALCLLLLAVASLRWPFSWDHGVFAWIGDVIVHGGMPYRDAWDVKGPLTFYAFAAVELSLILALQYLGTRYFETAQPNGGWASLILPLGLVPLPADEEGTQYVAPPNGHHSRPLRKTWVGLRTGRVTPRQYDSRFEHPALSWTIADSRALAGYVRAHTTPDERVLVWSDPLVDYLSEPPAVGRFGFHVALAGTAAPTPLAVRNQQEVLAELSRGPPRIVAVGRRNLEMADSLNEANIAHRFPELLPVLRREYVPVARFGGMDVYERRGRRP